MGRPRKAFGGIYDMTKAVPVVEPTQWEQFIQTIGVTEKEAELSLLARTSDMSTLVRSWVRNHYRVSFVPENVLVLMGIDTGFIED